MCIIINNNTEVRFIIILQRLEMNSLPKNFKPSSNMYKNNETIRNYVFHLGWKNKICAHKLPSNNNKSIVFINLLLFLLIVSSKLAFFSEVPHH